MSQQAKHTPGPWRIAISRGQSVVYTRVGAGDYGAIAECGGMRPSQNENCANARLIAAAPELVEALEAIAKGLTNGQKERGETFQSIALAAIAKAKGE